MTTPTAVMDLEGKVALRTDEALRKEVPQCLSSASTYLKP
jgi:hypothetical protein